MRLGRFGISRMLVERDEETVRSIMGRCVIVRCEQMFERDVFEYVAVSPAFDEIAKGEVAPAYDVLISEGGNKIEFKRANAK